jgi:hypothetical protein
MLSTRTEPEEWPNTCSDRPQKPIKIAIVQHVGYATIRFSQSSRVLFEADLAPAVAAYLCEALTTALANMVATMSSEAPTTEAATAAAGTTPTELDIESLGAIRH